MGYYSKVQILARKQAATKILAALQVHGSPFDEIKISPTGETYYFGADTKWYDDYPDIAAVMNALDELDAEDYRYIEVGEDGDGADRGIGDGYISEASIYYDGRDDCIDAWLDVSPDGEVQHVPAVERLQPFWDDFKKKAKLFGVQITVELKDIAK